jgi:hypothetical protein
MTWGPDVIMHQESHLSQKTGVSKSSARRATQMLKLRPSKTRVIQMLQPRDPASMTRLRPLGRCDHGFESSLGHATLMFVLCVRFSVFVYKQRPCDELIAHPRSPTVLDLVTEMKRKCSWRRPRFRLGCRANGERILLQLWIDYTRH